MSKLLRQILDMSKCPKNPVVTIYDKDGIKVGSTSNDIEFAYIRQQIAKNEIEGCYFTFNDKKYPIETNGEIHQWPYGCFDVLTDMTGELIGISLDKHEERSKVIDMNDCPFNEYVKIYDNEGKLICWTNDDLVWHWVRLQIKLNQLNGCYVIFEGERYEINPDGRLPIYPKGLFDENTRVLAGIAFNPDIVEKHTPKSKLISINKCPSNEPVEIYDNEDKLIVNTSSDLTYDWVRARIKEKKLKGCYIIFRGERIEINEYGCPVDYPDGMFDKHARALCDLI